MIATRFFPACLFISFLAPSAGWAVNESASSPATQSAPAQTVPLQPAIVQPAAAKPAPAPPASPKPFPITVAPAASADSKHLPAASAPVAPAVVKPLPVKPVPAPLIHAPVKPAPAPIAPAKSLQIQSAPLKSAPIPATLESFADTGSQTIDMEVFVRDGCPQCDKAKEFLAKLQNLQPQLNIIIRDVRKEPAALELLKRMAENLEDATLDYPAFVVGGQLILGFSEEDSTAQYILEALEASHPNSLQNSIDGTNCTTGKELSCGLIPPAPVAQPESIVLKFFGYNVPLLQIGLPLLTLAMGLLDGFNHGSTWALILMISLLAPMKNRPLMLAIAGTFIATQALVYFILMAAWLNLILQLDISHTAQIAFAGVSLIAAAIYFRSYMHFGQSLSASSHEIAKPGTYTRIRKIMETKNLVTAMLGTIALAIIVQALEFSYTSVFPALYTQTLTLHKLDSLSNYAYLLLYDFAYMLDDIIVLAIAVFTLSARRSQDKEGRTLKLISGLTLAGLGVYLLLTRI